MTFSERLVDLTNRKHNAMKTNAKEPLPCFECEEGKLMPVIRDYNTILPEIGEVTISKVPMFCCDQCGDLLTDKVGDDFIQSEIDRIANPIKPDEIHHFLQKYNLTQKTASQITGYGEKNISRWLSGKMRPSSSVSNFLRLISADESAFEKLKMKNFGEAPPKSFPCEVRQPDDAEKKVLSQLDYPKLTKLGVVKAVRSPKEKRTELCSFFQVSNLIDLGSQMNNTCDSIAAFKDTKQAFNRVSGGAWVTLGTMAARKVSVSPYHRDKLEGTIEQLREYTQHEPEEVIEEVQAILAKAGVALVFIPIMKHSALRGCTRLLTKTKAMIIHSLKYRTLSQFWLILFHEIAHLLLHIETPEDVFAEYAEQAEDPLELEADEWARDTLVYSDKLVEFMSRHPKPKNWEIKRFSSEIKVHASIIAEVFNRKKGRDVISYAYLRKDNLFPSISDTQAEKIWKVTTQYI